jgi:V/A-type H+-transporting ATPase subunit I
MIVEMSRVIVFGPKRLLGHVTEAIQRIGAMHVDRVEAEEVPTVRPMEPGTEEAARQGRLEALSARASGLLALLPRFAEAQTPDLSGTSIEDVEALLEPIESSARDLTRRRLEAEEELELIAAYENAVRVLSPLLDTLSASKHFETYGFLLKGKSEDAVAALQKELHRLTEGRVEVVSQQVDDRHTGVVVAFRRRDAEEVRSFLQRAGMTELRLPAKFADRPAAEAIREMERLRQELPREIAEATRGLEELSKQARGTVQAIEAYVRDELAKLQVLPRFAQSRFAFIIHGWVPTEKVPHIRGILRRQFGDDVVVYDAPADPHDHHGAARVPVILRNPPWAQPFTLLLKMFRPPRYGYLDPTMWVAIFFPIFIGLLMGDVAYGLVFFWLGWGLRKRARAGVPLGGTPPRDMADRVFRMLNVRIGPPTLDALSWVVRVCAAWTILFGVLYSKFFGDLLQIHFGISPFFDRAKDTDAFLRLVLGVGVAHVLLGLGLHLLGSLRHRNWFHALEALATAVGAGALLVFLGAHGGFFPLDFAPVAGVLALAFGIVFVAMFFVRAGSVLEKVLMPLESFAALGHILSYARLFALGLAKTLLAKVANELGGMAGPVLVGIVFGIFIQLVFLMLTVIGLVIQPARLNWVEFFTKFKFHSESGEKYQPFQRAGGE